MNLSLTVFLFTLLTLQLIWYIYMHKKDLDHDFISNNKTVCFSNTHSWVIPFQLSLNGNPFGNQLLSEKIASGSVVSLKCSRYDAYFLHSHPQFYPDEHSPKQQQVTGYPHLDSNSLWKIIKYDIWAQNSHNISEYIFDNDLIILQHIKYFHLKQLQINRTGRNLHSHREKAPISTKTYQVSYNNNFSI
ncbi:hypothetical protein MXB_4346 [Myxobolus squamalis]|nr:hypothetical protein MXB_4346 [Myxobolus squamalis]